jgi:K+-sensing histidine kinase KdpD
MKKLFTFESLALFIIALVMINNVEHLAWVHYNIARHVFHNPVLDRAHSIAVVIIIELSIILLVARGLHVFAGVYTFMLLVLQLLYYPLATYYSSGEYGKLLAAAIYSCMFTLSIYYFARMAANRQQNASELEQAQKRLCELERELHYSGSNLQQMQTSLQQVQTSLQQRDNELQQSQTEMQQLKKQLQQLRHLEIEAAAACTCDKCGQKFASEASKRSHSGRCKGGSLEVAA